MILLYFVDVPFRVFFWSDRPKPGTGTFLTFFGQVSMYEVKELVRCGWFIRLTQQRPQHFSKETKEVVMLYLQGINTCLLKERSYCRNIIATGKLMLMPLFRDIWFILVCRGFAYWRPVPGLRLQLLGSIKVALDSAVAIRSGPFLWPLTHITKYS